MNFIAELKTDGIWKPLEFTYLKSVIKFDTENQAKYFAKLTMVGLDDKDLRVVSVE